MIVFDLECSSGHAFEGWFNNLESFEEQKEKELIICPFCSDTKVKKVLSPVAAKTSSIDGEGKEMRTMDYRRLAREVVNYIQNNFEDVGSDFAKEALKMHYAVTEKRNIKGSATEEEEKLLKEEGIDFFRMLLPKTDEDPKN
jgi:hypothetical protein